MNQPHLPISSLLLCIAAASCSGELPSSGTPGVDGSSAPVDGACGAADGVEVTAAPTEDLCSDGTPSAISGAGPWTWTCDGSGGGGAASCSAPLTGTIPRVVVWQDNLQTEADSLNWGPGFFPACGWSGQTDCFGADPAEGGLGRVPDPAGGGGFALRHYIDPANGGGRAQYSMASWTNSAFGAELADGDVWIEWEVYFPEVPTSTGPTAWLSIMDFHSHGSSGEEWWATNGALLFASEAVGGTPADAGKLRMRDYSNTQFSGISPDLMPAGRWVTLLVHYTWSTSEVPVTLYVDGVEAMQLYAVTKHAVHSQLEFMVKLYGAGDWTPSPFTYYTRNVKILSF